MKVIQLSHLDHGLTQAHIDYILERFKDRAAFFIETIELPAHLAAVPGALYGPIAGDPPIPDSSVRYVNRGARTWPSRIMTGMKSRPTRVVTVVAGPHDGEPCVLYTCYGGKAAPQEPADPNCKDPAGAAWFWAQHALADE